MTADRLALTLGTLAFAAVVYALMLKGWRGRQRRQADLPAPASPPVTRAATVVGSTPGLFVGTVLRSDSPTEWLDRVAVHRLSDRATADLLVTADGLHVTRDGLPELYVPLPDVEGVEVGSALAGKVMGAGGLLLVDWRLGDRVVTSGFRATDHAAHPRLASAITALLPVKETS